MFGIGRKLFLVAEFSRTVGIRRSYRSRVRLGLKINFYKNKINETNNSMDDRFMMFFENDDDAVFNKKRTDS